MTLMIDDIEWYPLPEVEETLMEVEETASSCTTSASSYSTAPSLSYLTPASSVASFRANKRGSNSSSDPHITGTVQPYLKRQSQGSSGKRLSRQRSLRSKQSQQHSTISSSQSRASLISSSSTVYETGSEHQIGLGSKCSTVSIQTSLSLVGLKSSSAPSLNPPPPPTVKSTSRPLVRATGRCGESGETVAPSTVTSQESVDPQDSLSPPLEDGDECSTEPAQQEERTPQSNHAASTPSSGVIGHGSTTAQPPDTSDSGQPPLPPNAVDGEQSVMQTMALTTGSSGGASSTLTTPSSNQPPHPLSEQQPRPPGRTEPVAVGSETDPHLHPLTTPASTTHSPVMTSFSSFHTGPKPPPSKQQATISLAELKHLWMDFLTHYLDSASIGGRHLENREEPSTPLSTTPLSSLTGVKKMGLLSDTRDAGIQTTPSLAMSIPSGHQALEQPTSGGETSHLSQLTLQESLKTFRPNFIQRSKQRQRELKRNSVLRSHSHCRATPPRHGSQQRSRPASASREGRKTPRSPHFILIDVTKTRPKMSPVEIYRNSKRYWCKLPEVQQKVLEQKRESQATTNRLRMKLYQQEVLERLRRNKK